MFKNYCVDLVKLAVLLVIWASTPSMTLGQIAFIDRTDLLIGTVNFSYFPVAVVDMDGDMLDDIVRFDTGGYVVIEYQAPQSMFEEYNLAQIDSGLAWGICVADADKNGFNDILFGGQEDSLKILIMNGKNSMTSLNTIPPLNFFLQGVNFVDINNDSWIDVYACNDDGRNYTYGNDGSGALVFDTTIIIASQDEGNYASVWTDFDNDGDQDVYISKCVQNAAPGDPRIINLLYINDGSNNFSEGANQVGIDDGAQSWSADFGDIDNDGDMDLFVVNHDKPSVMYLNNGDGTFSNINSIVNLGLDSNALSYQCLFRDFDNNGYVDLLIGGFDFDIFWNDGNLVFYRDSTVWPVTDTIISFAVGDLNTDGFPDIYAIYLSWSSTQTPDKILINSTNTYNFLDVFITGTTSNINGIGTRLELYGPWGVQIREVRSGESYGIMNSFKQHFGLSTYAVADSLIVKWPSGIIQRRYNVAANQVFEITEGVNISIHPKGGQRVGLIYPNPASQELKIRMAVHTDWHFQLFDLSGKVVKSADMADELEHSFDVSDLPTGTYTYQIQVRNSNLYSGKIIIE
ncbi:MAG: VCBS repeat-containing protein [Flavobacteriales bacterium]|nr:VCBS repeat-containing protein [Flavobacteriales bacterium]